jgi:ABC-2 type transport system permease protein
MRIRHLGHVGAAIIRQAVVREAEFRSQLWLTLVVGVLEIGVALVPPLLVFDRATAVRGWTIGGVLAVTGAAQLLTGLLATFVAPNQAKMTDYIRRGDLDQMLIRPVPTQLFVAVRWIRPAELWTAVAGAGLIIIGCRQAGLQPDPAAMMVAAAWFVAGLAATALLWTNLGYLAFWTTSAAQLSELLGTILTMSRYPLTFYPAALRAVLLSIIPIGFATTVPIQALEGLLHPELVIVAVPLLAGLVLITRLHWLAGVRRYGSASS